jgi:hypothetical protein
MRKAEGNKSTVTKEQIQQGFDMYRSGSADAYKKQQEAQEAAEKAQKSGSVEALKKEGAERAAGVVNSGEKNALDEAADAEPVKDTKPKSNMLPPITVEEETSSPGAAKGLQPEEDPAPGSSTGGQKVRINKPGHDTGGPQSKADGDSFNTAEVLPTRGPSHFDDFPGIQNSDGVGA